MRAACALVVVALLAPAGARADRYRRGQMLFEQRQCTHCHSVGWQKPAPIDRKRNVDLTTITTTRSLEELRRWLLTPARVKPDTECRAGRLDAAQVDDLIQFLRARARPQPAAPKPPPATKPVPR